MDCFIVIPVRSPHEGKTRLASVLPPAMRAELVERMFRHVLGVASAAVGSGNCLVVSRSPTLLALACEAGAQPLVDEGRGLNPALEQAARSAPRRSPLLALCGDLPLLGTIDVEAMVSTLRDADVVAATDTAESGTNALLMRRPQLLPYGFGESSLARHRSAAVQRELRFAALSRPGLSTDIDHPADLARWQGGVGCST